jgi:hypothetical protein
MYIVQYAYKNNGAQGYQTETKKLNIYIRYVALFRIGVSKSKDLLDIYLYHVCAL